MSHELESGFFYKDPAWHKLGTVVQDVLTAEEAIVKAGLDWEVEKVHIFHNFKGNRVMIEDKMGIRRNTDGRILGILSPTYEPVQNKAAFGFFDTLIASKDAKYHTAGSLQGGQKVWILAKINGGNGTISIKGDAVDKYLLLLNGHDGTMALKMFFTPVRVVCMNTLRTAEAGSKRAETFYAIHTGGIEARMAQAREILGISLKFYDAFTEQANMLANLQLPSAEMPKLLVAAFQTTGAIKTGDVVDLTELSTRRQNQYAEVVRLFDGGGKGLDNSTIAGTKWAAYNAIAEYVDYGKVYHGELADNNRLAGTWFQEGSRIKQRAWDYLLKSK